MVFVLQTFPVQIDMLNCAEKKRLWKTLQINFYLFEVRLCVQLLEYWGASVRQQPELMFPLLPKNFTFLGEFPLNSVNRPKSIVVSF